MKCPICENYFDRDKVTFKKIHHFGKEVIRVCPACYEKHNPISN